MTAADVAVRLMILAVSDKRLLVVEPTGTWTYQLQQMLLVPNDWCLHDDILPHDTSVFEADRVNRFFQAWENRPMCRLINF